MSDAIWRNATVKLVATRARTAVIITPLGYALEVRASEVAPMNRRKKPKSADNRKF